MDNNEIKLQKVYSNLYNEIVQPDRVCVITQYFRTQWMPRLNPRLAWLIINLRQHCYWNKQTGELRDWCIVDQEELSRELGADKKTLRRLMKSDFADKFILEARTDRYRYDSSLGKQVRKKTRYRIRMDDPLTPEDEIFFKERLKQEMAGLNIDPETGQMDWFKLFNRPLAEIDPAPKGQNAPKVDQPQTEAPADQRGKTPSRSNTAAIDQADEMPSRSQSPHLHQPDILPPRSNERDSDQADEMPPRSASAAIDQGDKTPPRSQATIDSVEYDQPGKTPLRSVTKGAKRPQYNIEDKMPPILYQGQNAPITTSTNKYNNNSTDVAVVVINPMRDFGITEPALSTYQNRPPDQILGWLAYAQANALGPGFVVARLKADAWPPANAPTPPDEADSDFASPAAIPPPTATIDAEALTKVGLTPADIIAWQTALTQLRGQMTKAAFDSQLQGSHLVSYQDNIYTIAVSNQQAVSWLENRRYDLVARALSLALPTTTDFHLRFVVAGEHSLAA